MSKIYRLHVIITRESEIDVLEEELTGKGEFKDKPLQEAMDIAMNYITGASEEETEIRDVWAEPIEVIEVDKS